MYKKPRFECLTKSELYRRTWGRLKDFVEPAPDVPVAEVPHVYRMPPEYFTSQHYFRYQARADWTGAPDDLMQFAGRFLEATRKRGIPMYAHTVYRSPGLQSALKGMGLSNLASGAHQRSCAVDFVHAHYQWRLPKNTWEYLGLLGERLAKKHGIAMTWGGHWSDPWDPAHWEIRDWPLHPPTIVLADHKPVWLNQAQLLKGGIDYGNPPK